MSKEAIRLGISVFMGMIGIVLVMTSINNNMVTSWLLLIFGSVFVASSIALAMGDNS